MTEDVIESCHNGIVSWERESNVKPVLIQGVNDNIKTIERWKVLEEFFDMKKIDYKIIINYSLNDIENRCSNILNTQTSSFSFTPKSSGYNFASDVLFEDLLREAVLKNLNSFISFANSELRSQNCINEN